MRPTCFQVLLGIMLSFAGCATPSKATTTAGKPTVAIRILGATIGPAHADGTAWDGGGKVAQEMLSGVNAAMATANPPMAVAALLAGPLFAGTDKPDPCGWAQLRDGPDPIGEQQILLPCKPSQEPRNTFTPLWPTPAEWRDVELTPATSVTVHLEDWDTTGEGRFFDGPEPMG